ncbi:unnamed protein product [Effrenium voratum]|nr:unnamed protein product [Effrenium voratum]
MVLPRRLLQKGHSAYACSLSLLHSRRLLGSNELCVRQLSMERFHSSSLGTRPVLTGNLAIVARVAEEHEAGQWSDSDVSEAELDDIVKEMKCIDTIMASQAKTPARKDRSHPELLHVVLVVDASWSMAIEDIEILTHRAGCDVKLPKNVRRVDAVFHASLSFLDSHQDLENGQRDTFSLIVFNSKSQVLFARLEKKSAYKELQRASAKVRPKDDTKFQTAFQGVHNLLGDQAAQEDVRVIFLSDGKPYEANRVMPLFEKQLLLKSNVQSARSFEIHTVAFGSQPDHFHNLQNLAEMTRGTFQVCSLNHLNLRQVFTSIAATISTGASAAPLRMAALDIPFDPLCNTQLCERQCILMKHSHKKQKEVWGYIDEVNVICSDAPVSIHRKPFAFGGMRLVYSMFDRSEKNNGQEMVAKRLINNHHAGKADMLPFCRCTSIASCILSAFLKEAEKRGVPLGWEIVFVPCYLYEYTCVHGPAFFVGEQCLDGDFVKFNGNNGYVNLDHQKAELMQAFSHFTYVTPSP